MFKFRKEIGWAEIIAAGAIILSAISLWQTSISNEGFIVSGGGVVTTGIVDDKECLFIASVPLEFHNSGKTAVSLERFTPKDSNVVFFLKNNKVLDPKDVEKELYLSNQPMIPYLPMWVKLVRRSLSFDPNSYGHINNLIYPNDSYRTNLVLLAKNNINGVSISDRIAISFYAVFGNGQSLPISMAIDVTQLNGAKCRN